MGRPTAEALMLSALILRGDVNEAASYGITAEHFRGYGQEYGWVVDYAKTYGETPSVDAFCDHFPDFPFRQHENVRYAADEMLHDYAYHRIQENLTASLAALRNGDVVEAGELMSSYTYAPTSAVPADLVTGLDFLDDFDQPVRGIDVPWKTLDRVTGGIRGGNFWIFGARPSQGKSAFLTHIAVHNLMQGRKVLYYSLEMSDAELRSRVHAELATRLGYRDITAIGILRRTVDLYAYKQFVNELKDRLPAGGLLHTHTPSDGPVSPAVVASRAADYDLVVIDYLTLMNTDTGQHASEDWRTATQISNRLKQVALATGTPILAAAQINRDGDAGDLPPRLKNLAQADALGQDADVVVTLRNRFNASAALSVEKNRHGPSGVKFWTRFDVNTGIYSEVTQEKSDDLADEGKNRVNM